MPLFLAALAAVALIVVSGWIMSGSWFLGARLAVQWFGVMAVLMVPAGIIGAALAFF